VVRRRTPKWRTKAMERELKKQRAKKQNQKARKAAKMSKRKEAVAVMFLLQNLLV
jgi:hypothetical protein